LKQFGTAEKNMKTMSLVFSPYLHKTNNLSYNIYNHGNKGLRHKFLNLITAVPGIVLMLTHIKCL